MAPRTGLAGRLLKPKPAAFKFGAIALFFIGISMLFPLFINIGAANFATLAYVDMLLAGLIGSYIMSEALRKKTEEMVVEPVTIISMQNQLNLVLPMGLIGGVLALIINASLNISGNYLLGSSWGMIDAQAFYLGFLAGVAEELFFRGFLQSLFELIFGATWFGRIVAIFPAAAIFSLFHWFAYQTLTAFIVMFGLGCVFGLLHAISKDIGTPILAHVVNNSFAMLPFVVAVLQQNTLAIIILGVFGSVGFVMASIAFAKKSKTGKVKKFG